MADDLKRICFFLKDAVFAAGDVLMQRRGDDTAACAAEDAAAKVLQERWHSLYREDAGIHARQSGAADTGEGVKPYFYIDGLGGRIAFERGMDSFCTSIAYMRGSTVLAAAVFDPVHVRLYHAAQALGAYCNGKRVAASAAGNMINAVVSVDPKTLRTACPDVLRELARQTMHVCTEEAGALAMCRVAAGCIDAAVCTGRRFDEHAAGVLIAAEAGAVVTDRTGDMLIPGAVQGVVAAAPGISGALAGITARF